MDWVTPEFRDLNSLWKDKIVAVVIVANGGGENVKRLVLDYFPSETKKLIEIFSYREYGTFGYKGDLTKNEQVASRVKRLAENIYRLLKCRSI